jgi:hypothetical protein
VGEFRGNDTISRELARARREQTALAWILVDIIDGSTKSPAFAFQRNL